MLGKGLLAFNALVFLGFGGFFLVALPEAAAAMSVQGTGPNGWVDLRATYGGALFSFAIWLIWCLQQRDRYPVGLLSTGIVLAGFLAGRIVGLFTHQGTTLGQHLILVSELLLVPLLFYARHRQIQTAELDT